MCRLFYTPSPSVKAVIQKKSGFDTSADLGEPPREAGSNKGLVLRTQMLAASTWGSLFHHEDMGADQHCFGVLPGTHRSQEFTCPLEG